MQIKILNVGAVETKQGPKSQYKQYKLDFAVDGQARNRNIMQFAREVFPILKTAQPNEFYEITTVKNGEYWDWTKAVKVEGQVMEMSSAAGGVTKARSAGGTWETAEERARKQVMIVRQSSIASAVNLVARAGLQVDPPQVISIAKQFESYVLNMDFNPEDIEVTADLDDSNEVI